MPNNKLAVTINSTPVEEENKTAPDSINREQNIWRRFEATTEDKSQIQELEAILDRVNLTRRELAVIVATLRVRPEFSLADFDT